MPLKKTSRSSFSRLLVVVGWAIAAVFQLPCARADAAKSEPQREPDTVLFPKGSPATTPAESAPLSPDAGIGSGPYVIVVLVLIGAGVWLLWKRRGGEIPFGAKTQKKLTIEESKSLGNRQFLVVASYEEKRFLLGVTAERIQMLADLSSKEGDDK